jgi:hypothetical protein
MSAAKQSLPVGALVHFCASDNIAVLIDHQFGSDGEIENCKLFYLFDMMMPAVVYVYRLATYKVLG